MQLLSLLRINSADMWTDVTSHLWTISHNSCLEIQSHLQSVLANVIHLANSAEYKSFFFIKLALFTQIASIAVLTCKSVSVHTVVHLSHGCFYFGTLPNAYLIVIESYFNKIIYLKRAALLKGRHSLLESIKQI